MNAKTVLSKIITLLSKDEEKMTYAKLADGTIVESPSFDVGEPLEVVSEDGSKSAAPDGTHELSLRDEEGNETLFKVVTEGGVIVERENVELEEETLPVEDLPETTDEPEENKVEMEEELPSEEKEEEKEIEINLEDVIKKVEEMSYRVAELEKILKAQEEEVKEEEVKEEMEEEEEEPKLDGAPVEAGKGMKFSKVSNNKVQSYQSAFLKKLYN